jgi:hypothetical protein
VAVVCDYAFRSMSGCWGCYAFLLREYLGLPRGQRKRRLRAMDNTLRPFEVFGVRGGRRRLERVSKRVEGAPRRNATRSERAS